MPHSHNDPGWLWTYDMYYQSRTRTMFDYLITFLKEGESDMPFHWSESVSLLRWYRTTSEESRQLLKSAIKSRRVLIDHGSWSMPDEASTTVYSLVENLILGHTWLEHEFGLFPEYSWANDPFGHSSTMPYLLKQSGLKGMVINRIDMLLKKELREKQMLEFYWRQGMEEKDNSSDMLTHILPHALYSTREAFGPQLDFAKTFDFSPSEMQYLPLVNIDMEMRGITNGKAKVERRAYLLSQQIHHRSAYFKHNVLLCPIGDDFRYITYEEFIGVDKNWGFLKKYYEDNPQHKVRLQFGTLADYFRLLEEHTRDHEYPVLSGDFFPYSDNSDYTWVNSTPSNTDSAPTYWTGYFTTRPLIKVGIKRLEVLLRQAEILYSVYKLESKDLKTVSVLGLSKARETLSWLLHHDAITGTSPTETILDFMVHLKNATSNLENFSVDLAHTLGTKATEVQRTTEELVFDTSPHSLISYGDDTEDVKRVISVETGSDKVFTLYNSLLHAVDSLAHIKLKVAAGRTELFLTDSSGKQLPCQINPILNPRYGLVNDYVELVFAISLPSMARRSYKLSAQGQGSCKLSSVTTYVTSKSSLGDLKRGFGKFSLKINDFHEEEVQLKTSMNEITISAVNGTLLGVNTAGRKKFTATSQQFGIYNEGDADDDIENGLYIFTTPDEGIPLVYKAESTPPPLIISGDLETIVVTGLPYVTQCLRINSIEHGVSITQRAMLTMTGDLFMRIGSTIENGELFYTDSNSFTMMERRNHYPEHSLASNYYPMTSSAFINDENQRITLLTMQPLGVTSVHKGELEVMLDRMHETHDHGGVNDILLDKQPVTLQFRLLVEAIDAPEIVALTTLALHYSLKSTYPVQAYAGDFSTTSVSLSLPCQYHLINLRSLDTLPFGKANATNNHSTALILQRFATIEGASSLESHICRTDEKVGLQLPKGYRIEKTSLSLLHSYGEITLDEITVDKPNSIQTYKIFRT
ncbi:alpha-mannosidase 2-like isoform X1 [Watersipora subatra]|uniref:alpha-mannosidase 2-like isoform X1 n=1 Tax=Watersipora subatra TaxID=2589382 RepID=UPI00355BB1A3